MRGRLSWHLFAFQQYSTNDSVQKYLEGMTKNPCVAVCLYCVYICVCRKMHRLTVHVVILHKHKTSWESKTNEHYSQKLFFYCLAKHLGYFIVLYVVLQTTSRKRGRWGLIKIVMGTELVRGGKNTDFHVFKQMFSSAFVKLGKGYWCTCSVGGEAWQRD